MTQIRSRRLTSLLASSGRRNGLGRPCGGQRAGVQRLRGDLVGLGRCGVRRSCWWYLRWPPALLCGAGVQLWD